MDWVVTERTLAERFPIGKAVTTKATIVGSTRHGIINGYVAGYPGIEFVVIKFPHGLAALPPEELQRNDLQHPACPSCQCERKTTRLAPRRIAEIEEEEDEDD